MASSVAQYLGDGVTSLFQVPFDYLNKAHVTATVGGALVPLTWEGTNTVRLSAAPAVDVVVEVLRTTPAATRLVDFVDGSVLTEYDLDLSALQLLFVVQESADRAARSLGLTSFGKFDARGLEIINVGEPTAPASAATRKFAEAAAQAAADTVAGQTVFAFVEAEELTEAAQARLDAAVARALLEAVVSAGVYTDQQRDALAASFGVQLTATATSLRGAVADGDADTLSASKSHANAGDATTLAAAKGHANTGDADTLSAAKTHANAGDATTLAAAKQYTDSSASAAQGAATQAAKTYTDGQVTSAKQAATDGDASTLAAAKQYTDSKPGSPTVTRDSLGLGETNQPTFAGLTTTAPGYGYVSMFQGDAGHSGFFSFFLKTGVRAGFIGYSTGTDIPLYAEKTGAFFNFVNAAEAFPPRINNQEILHTGNIPSNVARTARGTLTTDGTNNFFRLDHNLGRSDVVLAMRNSSNEIVIPDYYPRPLSPTESVVVSFGEVPPANEVYKWVVVG